SSMKGEDPAAFIKHQLRPMEAVKRGKGLSVTGQPVLIGVKTNRLPVSTNGPTQRKLISEQVEQRIGTQIFIKNKLYGRLEATLATEQPDEPIKIPAFNPADLFGNSTPIARKDQSGAELTSDPRVSVRFSEVPGGFLPSEDSQELSDGEVEKLVAEMDAIYSESESSLSDAGGTGEGSEALGQAAANAEKNTTVLYKKSDEEENAEAYDRRSIVARGGESLDLLIKGAGVDAVQSGIVAESLARVTKTKK